MIGRRPGFALPEILVAFVILSLAAVPVSHALVVSLRASWQGSARIRVALAVTEAVERLARPSGGGASCSDLWSGSLETGGIRTVWTGTGSAPAVELTLRSYLATGSRVVVDSVTMLIRCD